MAKRIAIPFGFSFDRVLSDAVEVLAPTGEIEAICLVLGPRDGGVAVEGSTVAWSDRGEPRSAEVGVPITAVRLAPPEGGVLDLTLAVEAVGAFEPDAVVLNGGITPVQGVLWAQEAPKYDIQRDGALEMKGHHPRVYIVMDDGTESLGVESVSSIHWTKRGAEERVKEDAPYAYLKEEYQVLE